MTLIAPTLQAFFTDRLIKQLDASPRTIESYRDTVRLLLCFTHERIGTPPSALDWTDLDEPSIAAFLQHLEIERHNQRTHPEPPADRDPVPVQLRRLTPSRTRRRDRARAQHPRQAL